MTLEEQIEQYKKSQDLSLDLDWAMVDFSQAIKRIQNGAPVKPWSQDPGNKTQLVNLLRSLFSAALPYFVAGIGSNPVHHHTQVLDNMVRIGLGECSSYLEFKTATVLALLHDIGNAICELKKVKNEEISEAVEKADYVTAVDLAKKSVAFRLEHMDKGPELVRSVARAFIDRGDLTPEIVHFVCRAVQVHDYPSISESLALVKGRGQIPYDGADFLFRFDDSPFGMLVMWLREADRLYMVSTHGVLKDLRLTNIEQPGFDDRLKKNAKRHEDEYKLYFDAGKDDGLFRDCTLYRTATGYDLFNSRRILTDKKLST